MSNPIVIRKYSGFTVLELAIVVSVIGILVGLLLVGINAVRDSARRTKCTSNLKQIGLALLNYESAYKVFPRGSGQQGHGPLVCILPYIERGELFATIDFNVDVDENMTARDTRIDLYRCPSTLAQERSARTDYALNRGDTLAMVRKDPWFFDEKFFPRTHHFSKGLGGTALFSEICPRVESVSKGAMFKLRKRHILNKQDSDEFESECSGVASNGELSHVDNGRYWYGGGVANYFHIFSPNFKSCANGGLIQFSLYTATSMHSGGVNVLFADGRVEFMSDGVDNLVWRSFGTR